MTILADVILGWSPVLREIFAMMKLISSKVKIFYIRARFLNGRMQIFTGIRNTILKWSVVVRHGNSLSHKLKKFPYLIHSSFQNPIFSKLFDKNSKKGRKELIYFDFFIRKLSGNSRKLKRDFELQALNQSSLEFLFYAYKTLKINVPY